ncbi:hypothetical protein [uncultured Enterovirga sp.]|uniref:hypothetical protein n=1 Tax=uncultured Enterovirga sp. TaxID=2026352 RepID=UPI0035CB1F6F
MTGILAVWNDRADEIAADYERWYQTDHVPERLAVPGFRSARRYEATDGDRAFFTFYEMDGAAVLKSPAYTACLSSPSEMTRTIMPRFLGMIRSVFEEDAQPGGAGTEIVGGAAVVLRFHGTTPGRLPAIDGAGLNPAEILRIRLWRAAPSQDAPPDTTESRIRPGRDEAARGAIVVETMRVETAERLRRVLGALPEAAGASIGCFRLLCAFRNPDRETGTPMPR